MCRGGLTFWWNRAPDFPILFEGPLHTRQEARFVRVRLDMFFKYKPWFQRL